MAIEIKAVSVDALVQSPFWCRHFVEDEDFLELVESVKKLGVIEPPIVRLNSEGKFEIVAGHRRWLAAVKAELKTILVDVRKVSDEEAMEIQLAENVHRKDLSDLEKAKFLRKMLELFNCTQLDLAKKIGKSSAWVSQHLKMLELTSFTRVNNVTEGQARAILSVPEQKRAEVIQKVEKEAKKTGKVPSITKIQSMVQPELVECERCHTFVGKDNIRVWHGHKLCDKCEVKANFNPEAYDGYFKYIERAREKKVPEGLKPTKPQEKPEFKRARMSPLHSSAEQKIVNKLRAKGYSVETDVDLCVVKTTPDFNIALMNGKWVRGYIDGVDVHSGKRLGRDEELRDLLRKRYPNDMVIEVQVKGDSDREIDEKVAEIEEAMKF